MSNHRKCNATLSPYRILDLTEGGCMIGARILGDLGADVIKIEPPGGSPSRIAPFYKDLPDPEKSLFWFAYNINKRGITLDINKVDGQEIFKRLVLTADAVIESFEPDYMDQIGLGYDELSKIKSDIVLTSITPFGQTGPKAHYKGSDLTAWASGGYLYICGDPDRPPIWISFPQASLHAGAEAASGTMSALWHRCITGEGQHVDISIQECVIACCFQTPEMWDLNKIEITRVGHSLQTSISHIQFNVVWRCKDGYVVIVPGGGIEPFVSNMKSLVRWMDEEGMAAQWLKEMDWVKDYDESKITQDLVDRVEKVLGEFLIKKTKMELYEEGALKRHLLIGPLYTTKDIWQDKQLRARDFWVPVKHLELGDILTYCGPFVKLTETPIEYRHLAPLIGEHNIEIYQEELGVTREDLVLLRQAMII